MTGNLKQTTPKKFGFTWRVEHRGEDIDVYIPDYVNKTYADSLPWLQANMSE